MNVKIKVSLKVSDVTQDDSQRFLAQHRVQMLEQYCSPSKQCNNNVVTLCAKSRCASSRVTSPQCRGSNKNKAKACFKRRATAVISWLDCSSTTARH